MVEASDCEGSVQIPPDSSNYPICDGPSMDPGDGVGMVAALDDDYGAKGGD